MNETFGHEIEDQHFMKLFIDCHFEQTRTTIIRIFMVYLLGFVIPFIVQIFLVDQTTVIALCLICLACQLFFLLLEFLQVKLKGI